MMRITDLNAPPGQQEIPQAPQAASAQVVPLAPAREAEGEETRLQVELALLRARIEHLELVIETARGLMTASQEKLLRRLHDMPREISALSARLARLDGTGEAPTPWHEQMPGMGGKP